MKWKTQVELVYRVYVRQIADMKLMIDEVCNEIQELYPVRATFGVSEEDHWPILTEKVGEWEKRGILVLFLDSKPHVLVRSVSITIVCDSLEDAHEQLKTLLDKYSCKFAIAQVVQSFILDVHAV